MLKTGIRWEELPSEVFGVSGMTCWRRLRDWHAAGVFTTLQHRLLDELGRAGCIEMKKGPQATTQPVDPSVPL
jgi:transposase